MYVFKRRAEKKKNIEILKIPEVEFLTNLYTGFNSLRGSSPHFHIQ